MVWGLGPRVQGLGSRLQGQTLRVKEKSLRLRGNIGSTRKYLSSRPLIILTAQTNTPSPADTQLPRTWFRYLVEMYAYINIYIYIITYICTCFYGVRGGGV